MSLPATEVNDRGDLSGDAPRVGGGGVEHFEITEAFRDRSLYVLPARQVGTYLGVLSSLYHICIHVSRCLLHLLLEENWDNETTTSPGNTIFCCPEGQCTFSCVDISGMHDGFPLDQGLPIVRSDAERMWVGAPHIPRVHRLPHFGYTPWGKR